MIIKIHFDLFKSLFGQVEDPLAEATKYLQLLQEHSASHLETHLLSFEINIRKQKILLALQVSCAYGLNLRRFKGHYMISFL